ncbi:MAG: Sortase family protein [bacterium ADurb.Bin212]|nr:MAG: Sortase family protein [bacterium ADurb.Bin212]
MNHFQKIRNLFKVSAAIIFIVAVLLILYLVWQGLKSQKGQTEATSNLTQTPVVKESPDLKNEQKSQSPVIISSAIDLSAPITLDVNGSDINEYNSALEKGVAHLKGSALPGKNGNVFIFGHSSYDVEKAGQYKEVFAKLDQLANGDVVEIQSQEARYTYKVIDKKIVNPNDVSVAGQNFSLKQLTLMTCWPIGSTEKRLVVVAEIIE